jgi:hypothetical protein
MRPASEPLSEPQIHRAIRALDAGDRPDGATLRTALLMALAWHAAQAEIAALRATCDRLEIERDAARMEVDALIAGIDGLWRLHEARCGHYPGMDAGCTCGAAAYNARLSALLGEPQEPQDPLAPGPQMR